MTSFVLGNLICNLVWFGGQQGCCYEVDLSSGKANYLNLRKCDNCAHVLLLWARRVVLSDTSAREGAHSTFLECYHRFEFSSYSCVVVKFLGFDAKWLNLLLCSLLVLRFAGIELVSLPFNHLLEENGSHSQIDRGNCVIQILYSVAAMGAGRHATSPSIKLPCCLSSFPVLEESALVI